jgi:hypothetical protein
MGAQLGACKRKKAGSVGQAAAGVGVGARWGVRMGENRGGGEAANRWGAITVSAV